MVAELELRDADGSLQVRQDETGRVYHATRKAPLGPATQTFSLESRVQLDYVIVDCRRQTLDCS